MLLFRRRNRPSYPLLAKMCKSAFIPIGMKVPSEGSTRGLSRSSPFGIHRLGLPSRLITAGTRGNRTAVASKGILEARPIAGIFMITSVELGKKVKMLTMMKAALLMTRAVLESWWQLRKRSPWS